MIIINHDDKDYRKKRARLSSSRYNGAYYYSIEITNNIIPRVRTDRSWITVNVPGKAADHSIVFIHNNLHPERYDWLKKYDDLVLVCGVESTVDKVKHLGKAIYLPLSIDVKDVEPYKTEHTKGVCYCGRPSKKALGKLPDGIDYLENIPRGLMLKKMARYTYVYAVGRTAIEARALGCEILPYDPRYPDPTVWQVVDNAEAAEILQRELDEIDGNEENRQASRKEGGL